MHFRRFPGKRGECRFAHIACLAYLPGPIGLYRGKVLLRLLPMDEYGGSIAPGLTVGDKRGTDFPLPAGSKGVGKAFVVYKVRNRMFYVPRRGCVNFPELHPGLRRSLHCCVRIKSR
ncbi:MAG TPA: hypothetical protein VLK82_16155 [Candidatus Tectomicrobia bacterium]|nr:hypothetical protein [Candidatus Tectomicrobia bacterium]